MAALVFKPRWGQEKEKKRETSKINKIQQDSGFIERQRKEDRKMMLSILSKGRHRDNIHIHSVAAVLSLEQAHPVRPGNDGKNSEFCLVDWLISPVLFVVGVLHVTDLQSDCAAINARAFLEFRFQAPTDPTDSPCISERGWPIQESALAAGQTNSTPAL